MLLQSCLIVTSTFNKKNTQWIVIKYQYTKNREMSCNNNLIVHSKKTFLLGIKKFKFNLYQRILFHVNKNYKFMK